MTGPRGLDRDLRRHLDTVAAWLALEDPWPDHVDLMLLFGGSLPPTWERAARAVLAGEVGTLMLVGGRGHTTDALLEHVGIDPRSPAAGRLTEAEVMARWLGEEHGIVDVLLETRSTNCGNNVTLAAEVAREHGLAPGTVALVQDPTMQRRMDARFRHTWTLGASPRRRAKKSSASTPSARSSPAMPAARLHRASRRTC